MTGGGNISAWVNATITATPVAAGRGGAAPLITAPGALQVGIASNLTLGDLGIRTQGFVGAWTEALARLTLDELKDMGVAAAANVVLSAFPAFPADI